MGRNKHRLSFPERLKILVTGKPPLSEYTGQTEGFYKESMGWYNDPSSYDPIQQVYSPTNSFFSYPYGIYDEMKGKNTHVKSMLDTRVQTILSKPRRVIPADISAEAIKRCEFVVDMFSQMGRGKASGDFLHFLKNIQLNGIFYPFSVGEILWKYSGRFICPDEIKVRHPRNFSWNKEGTELQFMSTSGLQDLHPAKFIIYAPLRENDHPYKGGLSPLLYSIHNLMWLNLKWWGTSNERGGIPIILVQGSEFMDEPEKAKLEEVLDGLKNNIYAMMPDGIDIDAFESKMKAATNTFQDMASFCKREISLAVLGETLTSESGTEGSYSLGAVHQDTLTSFVQYDAPQLMELINGSVIPQLVAYNFPPKTKDGQLDWLLPKFVIDFEPPEDLQKRLLIDQGVQSLGITLSEKSVRERYRVDEPINPEDEVEKVLPGLGNLPSQDPSTVNEPGADNRNDPSKDLKDKSGPDTNKGRGKAGKIKSAAGFIGMAEVKRSFDIMSTFIDTVEDSGPEYILSVNTAFQRWVDKFDTLEEIQESIEWSEFNIEIGIFEEHIRNIFFQGYVLGYHQLFDDLRIKAAAEDKLKDTSKVSLSMFHPEEIVALFEARKILDRVEYDIILDWAKSRAFTVAGLTKEKILKTIKPLVRKGIYNGETKEWFVKQTEHVLIAAHARTVYQTNVATAYNYGRTDAVFDPVIKGTFPAATYFVIQDEHTTDICRAMIGKIVPLDELRHGQFVPPLHYNCRTILIFLTKNEYANISAPNVFTYNDQMGMPSKLKPQGSFGYYQPLVRVPSSVPIN